MKRFLHKVAAKALDNSLPTINIVAYGDSVTQGVMQYRLLAPGDTYHRLLQQELEAFFPTTSFNMINAGIAGESATQALPRLERDVLSHRPDLVIIAFGLNDAVGGLQGEAAFAASLTSMVQSIQVRTDASLILMTPPFMATARSINIHPEHDGVADVIIHAQTSGQLARYAALIRSLAMNMGIALADVHKEWQRLSEHRVDTNLWLINGLNHPNRAGHQLAKTLLFHKILREHLSPEVLP